MQPRVLFRLPTATVAPTLSCVHITLRHLMLQCHRFVCRELCHLQGAVTASEGSGRTTGLGLWESPQRQHSLSSNFRQMTNRATARTILLWVAFTRCSWRVECKAQRRESCSWRLHVFSLLELLSCWLSSAAQDLAALVRARLSCASCSLSSRVE